MSSVHLNYLLRPDLQIQSHREARRYIGSLVEHSSVHNTSPLCSLIFTTLFLHLPSAKDTLNYSKSLQLFFLRGVAHAFISLTSSISLPG